MDIVFGSGFDKLDHLKSNKLMYAITRYSKNTCPFNYALCDKKNYVGNFDTFLFYVRNITQMDIKEIAVIKNNESGMENLFGRFKTTLHI